jgi:hypothetical protein
MTKTAWVSPLRRAERLLDVRLMDLERALDQDPSHWPAYLETLDRFLQVRAALYPADPPMTRGELRRAYQRPSTVSEAGPD